MCICSYRTARRYYVTITSVMVSMDRGWSHRRLGTQFSVLIHPDVEQKIKKFWALKPDTFTLAMTRLSQHCTTIPANSTRYLITNTTITRVPSFIVCRATHLKNVQLFGITECANVQYGARNLEYDFFSRHHLRDVQLQLGAGILDKVGQTVKVYACRWSSTTAHMT